MSRTQKGGDAGGLELATKNISGEGLSPEEFQKARKEIGECLEIDRDIKLRIIRQLLRMSREQQRAIFNEYRWAFSRDYFERLLLYGLDVIPEYLSQQARLLPASQLKYLTTAARRQIDDPLKEVETLTPQGRVVLKQLGALNPLEYAQVVDVKEGIRSPKKQREYLLPPPAPKNLALSTEDVPVVHDMRVTEDRTFVLLYARLPDEPADSRPVVVKVAARRLRAMMK